MSNPFEAAIGYLLKGYKEAHGPAGPPRDPELKTALYEAATFLEAAGEVEHYYALCALDEPQMPEKGTEAWKDWVRGSKQLRAFIAALPDKEPL